VKDNPFDFPSPFWFGWSVCWATALATIGFAIVVVLPPEFPEFLLFPVGLWILAGMLCVNAAQERRFQIKHRNKR
jgi:hypothetical protein